MATSADSLLSLFLLLACCFNQLHAQRWGGAKPGCPEKCGNVSISYPFGIGEGCFHEGFEISCSNDSSQSYPIPLVGSIPVLEILQNQIRINNSKALAIDCRSTTPYYAYIRFAAGVGLSFLFLIATGSWVYWALQKRRLIKRKEEFFIQNGGLFLKRRLGFGQGSGGGAIEFMKIFTEEELKKATNNYHESGILGRGGYGTVYKGFLEDQRTVAIKRSKIIDESQKEQFINEVFILAQTDHRNIVKLLGCCLETQVPLLVYEFISNGTLFHHLHERGPAAARLTWDNRLRIAIETAEALAYLHSAPIIHRDVKSANILLDQNYTTKVADFGVSRLVPVNQSQVLTYVQGTFGYMDPEYFHTSQLTAKSDVYSFGVVLVELITGEKAVTQERSQSGTNLAMHFIRSMEEDRLRDVLEDEVFEEVSMAVFHRVAELAVKCLQLKGGKRPTMKEVEEELKGLRGTNVHAWLQQNDEDETEHLLGDVQGMNSFHETGTSQDSLQINNSILSIELGR